MYILLFLLPAYLFFLLLFSLVFSSIELVLTCILKNISTYENFLNKAITEIPSILTILIPKPKNRNNIGSDLKLHIAFVNRYVNKYYNNDIIRDM